MEEEIKCFKKKYQWNLFYFYFFIITDNYFVSSILMLWPVELITMNAVG